MNQIKKKRNCVMSLILCLVHDVSDSITFKILRHFVKNIPSMRRPAGGIFKTLIF